MLTTTIDGLWALQVLTGTEVVAPELGLRPHLPSVENADTALAHPIAGELHLAGVIDERGTVDPVVREWLTVLARRDVALLVCAEPNGGRGQFRRALLARFARWWVVLERCDGMVRLSAAGTAGSERSANLVIGVQIGRLLGPWQPAAIRPATLGVDALLAGVVDRESLRTFLIRQQLDRGQMAALLDAATLEGSAHASIVAIQSGSDGFPGRPHLAAGTVTVIDAPAGRLVAEHVRRDDGMWMIVGPGTDHAITTAVQKMLHRLPAEGDWHSYRKAV